MTMGLKTFEMFCCIQFDDNTLLFVFVSYDQVALYHTLKQLDEWPSHTIVSKMEHLSNIQ